MSVLTHPHLPHLRHGPSTTTPTVPPQRGTDRLQPWSPRPAAAPTPRLSGRTRAALVLAGLAVAGTSTVALVVAAPWEDDAVVVRAPATSVGGTTTDQARDDALSRRGGGTTSGAVAVPGAGTAGGTATDAQRDAVLEQRGQRVSP